MPAVPFNSIGQIIAGGGLTSLATGIAGGWSDAESLDWLGRHYTGIDTQASEFLIGLALGLIAGGEGLTNEFAAAIPEGLGEIGDEITIAGTGFSRSISLTELRELSLRTSEQRELLQEIFGIDILPIVPELFGDEPLGRRAQIGLEITLGDKNTRIRIDVDLAGVETWADLLELIEERIQQIDDTDPTRMANMSDQEKFELQTKIIYGVRRW